MGENSLAMMPWFPRDFIAATRAMRLAERGAYRELLDYQWEMGKLPAEHERLARLLGVTIDEFNDLWPAIKDKFVLNGTDLYNQRLEEHRKKALEQRDRKRRAAENTNAKRYGERPDERSLSDSVSDTLSDTLSASPPSPSPSPSIKEKKTPLRGAKESQNGSRDARPTTGCRLANDFELTPERKAIAEAEGVPPEREFEKFRDHWRAKAGKDGRKMDWDATWRNWCKEAHDRQQRSRGPPERKPLTWVPPPDDDPYWKDLGNA